MKLTVELVPKTSWGHNVRTLVPKASWDLIRKKCYRLAKYVCEICGGQGSRHPVECHEIWHYDDQHYVQTLVGFIALCPLCHRVKHLGRTFSVGLGNTALKQLALVNGITMQEAGLYVEQVFDQWRDRSKHPWKVDISYIDTYVGET